MILSRADGYLDRSIGLWYSVAPWWHAWNWTPMLVHGNDEFVFQFTILPQISIYYFTPDDIVLTLSTLAIFVSKFKIRQTVGPTISDFDDKIIITNKSMMLLK